MIGGDFNVVKGMEEKVGVVYNHSVMSDFSNFIEDLGLMDIPLASGRFTWSSNRLVATFCRLDRFLISLAFMLRFQNLVQTILPKSLSDHNAVSLEDGARNWGPRSFKFFNHWVKEQGFNELIQSTWENFSLDRSVSSKFWDKLKKTKVAIKGWYKKLGVGDLFRISLLEEAIDRIEKKKQDNHHDDMLRAELVSKKASLWRLYRAKNACGSKSRG